MRLLIDVQCVASSSALRGIGRYALSLTAALADSAAERGHQVEVLLSGGARQDRLLAARATLEEVVAPRGVHVFDAAFPWQQHAAVDDRWRPAAEAAYAAAVRSLAPDALLVASAFERDDEAILSVGGAAANPPTACVLYDLMPALHPATYLMGPEAATYWRRLDHLRRCQGLLAISDHSARQAAQVLGDSSPPVSTIRGGPYPSGAFPAFESADDDRPELVLPDRFVLSVGGDHPRKNLDRLVQAWGRVPASLRRDFPLVLACRLNLGTERRLVRAAARAGVRPSELLLLGRVSERRLQDLYARAELFVFPSVEEGLGMPPLEAAAVGCPTLLARGSSLSELTSREAAFFDPLDAADLANAIFRTLTDASARQALRDSASETARGFTWHETGRRAWAAIENLPARPPGYQPSSSDPVRLSDQPAVAGLAAVPGPVRLDIDLDAAVPPETTPGALGLPVGLRAALAPATALLAPSAAAASGAVRAGLLDHPIIIDEDQLPLILRHDWYAAYADGLSRLDLTGDVASGVLQAALRTPRWMLERPRPVWLLLRDAGTDAALAELAADAGVDLVQARPAAAWLAALVDVVLCPAVMVAALEDALARARGRGARTVAVHERVPGPSTPPWCDDVVLFGALDDPAAWRAHLGGGPPPARTTGWPWRNGA